jgi:hypothetical protein
MDAAGLALGMPRAARIPETPFTDSARALGWDLVASNRGGLAMLAALLSIALAQASASSPAPEPVQAASPVVDFTVQTRPLPSEPIAVVAAPLDLGATPDLALTWLEATPSGFEVRLLVLDGLGTGGFGPGWSALLGPMDFLPSGPPGKLPLRVADVNADGRADLVTPGVGGNKVLRLGNGSLVFPSSTWVASFGGTVMDTAFADWSGDGLNDSFMLVDDGDEWVDWSQNQGHTIFGDPMSTAGPLDVGPKRARMIAADLDGDGDAADVVVTSEQGLVLFGVAGNGPFSPAPASFEGDFGEVVAVDLDGDLDLDLVAARPELSGVSILENLGGGSFELGATLLTGRAPEFVEAADFDGDGRVDVAVSNGRSHSISVLRGDGVGGLALDAEIQVGLGPGDLTASDLDLDGDVDLVVVEYVGRSLSILLNTAAP